MSFVLTATRSCSPTRSRSPIGAAECSCVSELRYGRSFEPLHLRSVGRTYRFVNVDADVARSERLLRGGQLRAARDSSAARSVLGDARQTKDNRHRARRLDRDGDDRIPRRGATRGCRRRSCPATILDQRRRVGTRDLVSRPRITVRRHRDAGELAAARRRAGGSRVGAIRRCSTRSKRTPHAPSLRRRRRRARLFQSSPTKSSRSSVRELSTERRARRSRMAS